MNPPTVVAGKAGLQAESAHDVITVRKRARKAIRFIATLLLRPKDSFSAPSLASRASPLLHAIIA
jgi:hypothetical protein